MSSGGLSKVFINPEGGEALVFEVRPDISLRLRQGRAVQPDPLAVLTTDARPHIEKGA